jgi:hypothetical protein
VQKLPSNQETRFIENLFLIPLEEAEEIIALANEYNVKGQVGRRAL